MWLCIAGAGRQLVMTSSVQAFQCDAHGSQMGVEWGKWKRNFNYFIGANEIEEPIRKKRLLLLFAGEQVQEIYDSLDTDDIAGGPMADSFVDYFQRTLQLLDDYFAAKTNVTYERHMFRQLKQEAEKKLVKFAMRLRVQAKKCGFGDQLNDNIRDQLIEKCRSNDFRRDMLKKRDPSMDEILQYAAAFEAVEEQVKVFKQPDAENQLVNRVIEVKACYRCGSKRHQGNDKSCPAMGKKCFRCNGMNHFKSKCRSKSNMPNDSKDNQRDRPYNRPNNRWQKKTKEESSTEAKENESVNNISDDEKPFDKYVFWLANTNRIDCHIGGVSLSMVIDSGSRFNIIDKANWESLKRQNIIVHNST